MAGEDSNTIHNPHQWIQSETEQLSQLFRKFTSICCNSTHMVGEGSIISPHHKIRSENKEFVLFNSFELFPEEKNSQSSDHFDL